MADKALTRKNISVELVLMGASFGGEEGGNTKTVEGLACDVTIQKCGLPARNTATIKIFNMKQEDIEKITTLSPVKLEYRTRNIVTVKAWPEDKGPSVVFKGEIFLAYGIYESPDLGVHIEAQTGLIPAVTPSQPFTKPGEVKWKEIVESAVSEMDGYTFENVDVPEKILTDPVINGSPLPKIQEVARELDFQVICDDMKVTTMTWEKPLGNAVKVNATTGMVGYPSLNPNGIKLTHDWRPEFRQGGAIDVESIVPQASGIWKIVKLHHHLQSYGAGSAWDTIIDGIRINV